MNRSEVLHSSATLLTNVAGEDKEQIFTASSDFQLPRKRIVSTARKPGLLIRSHRRINRFRPPQFVDSVQGVFVAVPVDHPDRSLVINPIIPIVFQRIDQDIFALHLQRKTGFFIVGNAGRESRSPWGSNFEAILQTEVDEILFFNMESGLFADFPDGCLMMCFAILK